MKSGKPVGYQRWQNLLFIHWPIAVASVRALVPRQLEIDLYDGQAFVSLIPFVVAESRRVGCPESWRLGFWRQICAHM